MNEFTHTSLLLITLLFLTKWMGFLFKKMRLPELVGELIAGVILGNLALFGLNFDFAHDFMANEFFKYASELGVVLLLFHVGLETTFTDLKKAGANATLVAVVGVVVPVILGVLASNALGFSSGLGAWLVGATLAATSVGITAKILGDAGLIKSPSAQIILGAAVIDDVIGIILLVVIAGVATTGNISVQEIGMTVAKAAGFFIVSYLISKLWLKRVIILADKNTSSGFWTAFAIIFALAFAEISVFAGLAPIIGAFVAGLMLEDVHFGNTKTIKVKNLMELIQPFTDVLLPIFFVTIGCQVKLNVLADFNAIMITSILIVIAIIGKAVSGFVASGPKVDRLGIGYGMAPRGEVGLIFASYGLSHGMIEGQAYSVLVFVLLATTIIGPLLLKTRLSRF